MTRPSKHLDVAMIEAGKKIIIESGSIRDLTITNICRRAHVNPGMFSYCFKTKDNFLMRLVGSVFDEFYAFVQIENASHCNGLEQLNFCITKFTEFCLPRKHLFSELFPEITKNKNLQEKAIALIKERHILFRLIQRCHDEGYFDTTLSAFDIFTMIIAGSLQSSILCDTANDYSIREKLRIILKGLLKEKLENEKNTIGNKPNWRNFLGI
jgi:AcrR family transcriptional regulator